MKKSLWLILTLLLICIFALSACDNSTQNDETQNSNNNSHTHSFGEWETVKVATCTTEGMQERYCSCGEMQTKTIAATNKHAFGEWTTVKNTTCTQNGEKERSCSCGKTETQRIQSNGHTEVIDKAVEATCTKNGKTAGKHCSVCNKVIVAQQTIQASHTEVIDKAVAATCTTYGKTEGKHCSVCNKIIVAQQQTPMKAHTESDWIVDKEATVEEEGSRHKVCATCNSTVKTETISKIEPSQGLEFTIVYGDGSVYSRDYCYVSGIGTCTDTNIVIPSEYNGVTVRAIGMYAFVNCTSIKSVIIPGSVTGIREGAFKNCTSLETVTIPGGITFADYVFKGCSSLEKIDFKEWTGYWYYAISDCVGCFDYTNIKYKI